MVPVNLMMCTSSLPLELLFSDVAPALEGLVLHLSLILSADDDPVFLFVYKLYAQLSHPTHEQNASASTRSCAVEGCFGWLASFWNHQPCTFSLSRLQLCSVRPICSGNTEQQRSPSVYNRPLAFGCGNVQAAFGRPFCSG